MPCSVESWLARAGSALGGKYVSWSQVARPITPFKSRSSCIRESSFWKFVSTLDDLLLLSAAVPVAQPTRVPRPRLFAALSEALKTRAVVALWGLPGAGKTTLARDAARGRVLVEVSAQSGSSA